MAGSPTKKTDTLNQALIRQICGDATYSRGKNYFEKGYLLNVELYQDDDDYRVDSQVKGSHGQVYEQHISIDINPEYNFFGRCSCPMVRNCKHVVTVMLYLVDSKQLDPKQLTASPVERWLADMSHASQQQTLAEEAPANSRNCLLYILEPGSDKEHTLNVVTQRTRMLKKGGFGKPTAYPLEQTQRAFGDEFIQPEDKEITRLLTTASPYHYYGTNNCYALHGDLGELALTKMLRSGRCHWLDKDQPALHLGSPGTIEFHWQTTPEGQRLIHKSDPATEQLMFVEQLWYHDANNHCLGHLPHQHLSLKQLAALLYAPLIPNDELLKLTQHLLTEVAEYQLPTPANLEIKEVSIDEEQPRFRLRLHSRETHAGSYQETHHHCIQLSFLYGPVELTDLSFRPQAKQVKGDTIFTIQRDVDAEIAAMDTLYSVNFVLQNDNNSGTEYAQLIWLPAAESKTEAATLWMHHLQSTFPELTEQGWEIIVDDSFHLQFDEADQWHAELEEERSDWFSLTLGIELNGKRINLLPTLVELLAQTESPQHLREYLQSQSHVLINTGQHHWLKLPSERLMPIFETLIELYDQQPLDDDGKLTLSRHQSLQIGDLLIDPALNWQGAEEQQRISKQLRDFNGITEVNVPASFAAELRPYQQQGLNWLQFLREFRFNGILADDMGLGKTVQTLAHLLLEKQSGRLTQPCLVIAPTSLMGNWRRECERFTPELSVLLLHGSDRHRHVKQIPDHDIVLTTYPLLRHDQNHLLKQPFHYVVLDEAQSIKNPKSQTAQVAYQLNAEHRLCLTGTPMENHLGELWSMYHFLMPGFLGDLPRFNRLFRTPIERHDDHQRQHQLSKRLSPFLLRRTKQEVATELPEKTEIIRTVTLQGKQRDLYETIRLAMDQKVRKEIANKGVARSQIMILDALLKLRQVCCDPRIVSLPQAARVTQSAKLTLLMEMVPEMVEEGRRILIFSQFTKMLALIEQQLQDKAIDYCKLTGQTRKRDAAIDRFQQGDVPVFLISLKAGGVGLNLTAADTVIHYDPWWNPAAENQATDRAHRIGQDKKVFVYKLVTEETVEEKILQLQQKKQRLSDAIYSGKGAEKANAVTSDELSELLKPLD